MKKRKNVYDKLLNEQEMREIKAGFDLFDVDKSGAINFNQMSTALRKIGINLKDQQLQRIIEQYDQDGNGEISVDEFITIVAGYFIDNRSQRDYLRIFRMIDSDRDGFISKKDFQIAIHKMQVQLEQHEIDQIFTKGATAPDIGISYSDMLKLMLYHQ